MKRVGLICLAIVLALGALGVAYAPWTDEVYIEQTVQTGDVRIGFSKAEVVLKGDVKEQASFEVILGGEVVGETWYPEGYRPIYEELEIRINNAYPCMAVSEMIDVASGGSIPVHINELVVTAELVDEHGTTIEVLTVEKEWVHGELRVRIRNADLEIVIEMLVLNLIGVQLHEGGKDAVEIDKHFKQKMEQGAYYKIIFRIIAHQYNWDPNG